MRERKVGKIGGPAIALLLVFGMVTAGMPVAEAVSTDEIVSTLVTILLVYDSTVYYVGATKNADGDYVASRIVTIERDSILETMPDGGYIIDLTKDIPPLTSPPPPKYLPVYVYGYTRPGEILVNISVPPLGCGVEVVQIVIWLEAGLQNMWTGERTRLVGTWLSGASVRPYHDGTIPILDFLNLAINVAG